MTMTGLTRRGALAGALGAALAPALPAALASPARAATPAEAPAAEEVKSAAEEAMAGRTVPARFLPVPDTVSPALRPVIAAPPTPGWDQIPTDAAGWRDLQRRTGAGPHPILREIEERLGVTVEQSVIGGVPVFVSTPKTLPERNRNRVLMHLHGGGYVLFPGAIGAGEGMMMAGYGGFTVITVDYRMAPDFPFPAALDDAAAVWTVLAAAHGPGRMAVFGTSAGGGLTLALMLRAKAAGLPLPAATGLGSPWADLAPRGDTLAANEFVDNVLVSIDGWVGAAAKLYAGTTAVDDPLVSPIHGDFSGMPPAILTSGTRDLLLSDTVRTHRRLRQAGVEASLQVFEAMSHAQFLTPFTPETEEAFAEIAAFFDRHLAV